MGKVGLDLDELLCFGSTQYEKARLEWDYDFMVRAERGDKIPNGVGNELHMKFCVGNMIHVSAPACRCHCRCM